MGFVVAFSKDTGHQQMVPEHFFDQPELCRGLTRDVPAHVEVPGDEQEDAPAPTAPVQDEPPAQPRKGRKSKAAEPENPALTAIGTAHPPVDSDTTETPATGENQE